MDMRQQRVVVETDRYRIEGRMTVPREGYRSRLSDHVNRRDQDFLTLVDAQLTPLNGSGAEPWTAAVLMLARRHIRLIVPDDEPA